jgi:hypothetical protein
MAEIVHLESYRVARVLINALSGEAAHHAESMVRRMRRRHDELGEEQWRGIHAAIARLRPTPWDVSKAL